MNEEKNSRFFSLRSKHGLSILFALIVLLILVITSVIVVIVSVLYLRSEAADKLAHRAPLFPVLMLLVASSSVGAIVSLILSNSILRPLRRIMHATNQLAEGDFSVRLHIRWPLEIAELADSFNRMAQELENTELLRSDFVNNFSHEFKTPIVSIKGFAEMLKYGDLAEAERQEYLDIVIGETERLSSLATNVLNLSAVENQTILTEKGFFNVGEQIRRSVILLQPKWEARALDVSVDGDELYLCGNEELLSQVWLNLLDNAIKFSPESGKISLTFYKDMEHMRFIIRNGGPAIPKDAQRHIFDKFYQGDKSHAVSGNGLGLALVNKIVELHRGSVSCKSSERDGTAFTVVLPLD